MNFFQFYLFKIFFSIISSSISSEIIKYRLNTFIFNNFTKFIIDREGKVAARFEPTADMKKVEECIKALL